LNASSPTQPKPVAPTVTARFRSMLARLIGAKLVDKSGNSEPTPTATVAETIWSAQWCAQEPALAATAIATLQERVQCLEDYIQLRVWRDETKPRKPRKRPISLDPKGVLLSTLPPNMLFILLRTGEKYKTSGRSWRLQYKLGDDDRTYNFHGASRVKAFPYG